MAATKINAAFNMGGPQLLVQTVESVSGVHIDHYAEIGFGGFAKVVDSIGGIRICLKTAARPEGRSPPAGRVPEDQRAPSARAGAQPRLPQRRPAAGGQSAQRCSPHSWPRPPVPASCSTRSGCPRQRGRRLDDRRRERPPWNLLLLALSLRGSPTMATVPTGAEVWGADGDALSMDSSTEEFFPPRPRQGRRTDGRRQRLRRRVALRGPRGCRRQRPGGDISGGLVVDLALDEGLQVEDVALRPLRRS